MNQQRPGRRQIAGASIARPLRWGDPRAKAEERGASCCRWSAGGSGPGVEWVCVSVGGGRGLGRCMWWSEIRDLT